MLLFCTVQTLIYSFIRVFISKGNELDFFVARKFFHLFFTLLSQRGLKVHVIFQVATLFMHLIDKENKFCVKLRFIKRNANNGG